MLFLKHTAPEPEQTTIPEESFSLTPHQLSQQNRDIVYAV